MNTPRWLLLLALVAALLLAVETCLPGEPMALRVAKSPGVSRAVDHAVALSACVTLLQRSGVESVTALDALEPRNAGDLGLEPGADDQ